MKRELSTMSQRKHRGNSAVFLAETSVLLSCTPGWWGEVSGNSLFSAGVRGSELQKHQLFNKKRPLGLRREKDMVGKEGTKRNEARDVPVTKACLLGKDPSLQLIFF